MDTLRRMKQQENRPWQRTRFGLALGCAMGIGACARPVPMPSATEIPGLCVVRHAEAYKNLNPLPASLSAEELDSLTPFGEETAREIGERLPASVSVVLSSPANRTQETARLVDRGPVLVDEALRPLDGEMSWHDREEAWHDGDDPRPEGGENLADGRARVQDLLIRVDELTVDGEFAVLVTHGEIASLILGELRGTYLLDRPFVDTLETGAFECVALPPLPHSAP